MDTYTCERCHAPLTEDTACWFMAECVCPACFLTDGGFLADEENKENNQ